MSIRFGSDLRRGGKDHIGTAEAGASPAGGPGQTKEERVMARAPSVPLPSASCTVSPSVSGPINNESPQWLGTGSPDGARRSESNVLTLMGRRSRVLLQ